MLLFFDQLTSVMMPTTIRFRSLPLLLLAAACMIIASPADAQKRADARGLLPESSRPLVRDFDPTLQFNHRRVAGGRLDSDSGVWRAAYRIRATTPVLAFAGPADGVVALYSLIGDRIK